MQMGLVGAAVRVGDVRERRAADRHQRALQAPDRA